MLSTWYTNDSNQMSPNCRPYVKRYVIRCVLFLQLNVTSKFSTYFLEMPIVLRLAASGMSGLVTDMKTAQIIYSDKMFNHSWHR